MAVISTALALAISHSSVIYLYINNMYILKGI